MVLSNVHLLPLNRTVNIGIAGSIITSVKDVERSPITDPFVLNFEHSIAFPGLINSHDHLDFNLFPKLGDPPYKNYSDWGTSIHNTYKKEIEEVLTIPLPLRVKWGIYKNLLCGVTTVVDHGPRFLIQDPLLDVFTDHHSLHSVRFEKNWILKLNNPFKKNIPCVIHVGEGIDPSANKEINKLINWNLLKRSLIAIHGVAMDTKQAANFKGLIWCPGSNYFLFNETARIDQLKAKTLVCFGTDSTLTSSWNIWEHIRLAKDTGYISAVELFDMLTESPAQLWGLDKGSIGRWKKADIVIARTKNNKPGLDSFCSTNPEDILMVIQNGNIRLFDSMVLNQLNSMGFSHEAFTEIVIKGEKKFVEGDLRGLVNEVKKYNSSINFPFEFES